MSAKEFEITGTVVFCLGVAFFITCQATSSWVIQPDVSTHVGLYQVCTNFVCTTISMTGFEFPNYLFYET